MTDTSEPTTVLLIHGLWLNATSWQPWVDRFRARGIDVVAPSWPGMDRPIEEQRDDTTPVEAIGVAEIADHYEKVISELGREPIIIGHSFGGLITQILLDRGHGTAGVAIDSAPIKGVHVLPPSTLRSGFPALKRPANRHRAVMLSADEFHYAFANTLSEDDSDRLYETYAVPGPGRVLFQSAFANFNPHAVTAVDFHNAARAPLLIVSGGADHVSPPAVNRSELHHQQRSTALTAFKAFPDRPHFLIGTPGWEDVADFALAWAQAPTELSE
jgi:pimeloyl-ACP methyl ester carboxylesterase